MTLLHNSYSFLKAISNPTRLAILYQLNDLEKTSYSILALSLGLDPTRESGNFNYHINQLQKLGLIQLEDLDYSLTKFGRTVASLVDSISTEFILTFPQKEKGGEKTKMFKIKELEETDLELLALLKYGVLKEVTEGVVHDYVYSERIWLYGKGSPLGGEGAQNRSLIALDNDKIAGVI